MSNTVATQWVLELNDRLSEPLKKASGAAQQTQSKIEKVSEQLEGLKEKAFSASNALLGIGVGVSLGVVFNNALESFNRFEEAMALTNTMAGKTGKELDGLKDKIRNLSEEVPLASDKLATSLYDVISAGVAENNWISFLQDSSKAALAGNADMGTVINATATIIKNYSKGWEEAAATQDKFQKTVKLGQIPSLEALASALPRVTAMASSLKMTEDELLGTFATASGPMGSTAEVATQLASTLSSLLKPSKQAADAAEALGVVFDASVLEKAGSLQNYLNFLMPKIEAYAKQTGRTQQEIVGQLFGSQEAIKFVMGMGGSLAQSWSENTHQMKDATGTVTQAYDRVTETAASKMQLAKNAMNNAMGSFFDAIAPVKTMVFELATALLKLLSRFMRANPIIAKVIGISGLLITALIGLRIAFGFVGTYARLFATALQLMSLKAATGSGMLGILQVAIRGIGAAIYSIPIIGWIALAIGAIMALGAYFYNTSQRFRNMIHGIWSAAKLVFTKIFNVVKLVVMGILSYWMVLYKGVVWVVTNIYEGVKWAFGKIKEVVKTILDSVGGIFKDVFNGVYNFVSGIIDRIVEKFEWIGKAIRWVKGQAGQVVNAYEQGAKNTPLINKEGAKEAENENEKQTTTQQDNAKNTDGPGLNLAGVLARGGTNAAKTDVTSNKKGSSRSENQAKGTSLSGSGSNKSITMNLVVNNHFNVKAGQWRSQLTDMADQITSKINDSLRDGLIALD